MARCVAVALAALMMVVGLAQPAGATTPSPLGAQTDGLAYREDVVFRAEDGVVRVEVTATMTNTTTSYTRGNTIYFTYFDTFFNLVPVGATDLRVTSRGRNLTPSLEPLEGDEVFELLTARLPSNLESGQSRTFTLSYSLPVGDPRDPDAVFLTNGAYYAFPVYSFTDPGVGTIRVEVPRRASVEVFGDDLDIVTSEGDIRIYSPPDGTDLNMFQSYVSVSVDELLTSIEFEVSGESIELEAWPGDDAWIDHARTSVTEGIPVLEELIGLEMPDQNGLEITESVVPYFYGYGGWYDSRETSISVGSELDQALMLHELTHAWFNDDLIDGRWIHEGLAEEFAHRALIELRWPTEPLPTTPRDAEAGHQPLIEWESPFGSFGDDDLRAEELYGYNASWWTIRRLIDAAGFDAMTAAIQDLDADTISYVGDGPAETVATPDDWRRLLDLLSERSDADVDDELVEVLKTWVLRDVNDGELERRADARAAYDEFVQRPSDWAVPAELRFALDRWRFDDVHETIAAAVEAQDAYAAAVDEAADAGLALSDAARTPYELDEPDFAAVADVLDEQLARIADVEAVRTRAATPLNRNQQWGIGDADPNVFVPDAVAAFAADDPDGIAAADANVQAMLDEAERLGTQRLRRLLIAIGAAIVVLVLLLVVLRRRKKRRGASVDDGTVGEDSFVVVEERREDRDTFERVPAAERVAEGNVPPVPGFPVDQPVALEDQVSPSTLVVEEAPGRPPVDNGIEDHEDGLPGE